MSLMSMKNNKSPENNYLIKEPFVTFWGDMKNIFYFYVIQQKLKKVISTLRRHTA